MAKREIAMLDEQHDIFSMTCNRSSTYRFQSADEEVFTPRAMIWLLDFLDDNDILPASISFGYCFDTKRMVFYKNSHVVSIYINKRYDEVDSMETINQLASGIPRPVISSVNEVIDILAKEYDIKTTRNVTTD